ncbi:unnamed protein product, partial [Ectocarpus sp. 8 AP-2014]
MSTWCLKCLYAAIGGFSIPRRNGASWTFYKSSRLCSPLLFPPAVYVATCTLTLLTGGAVTAVTGIAEFSYTLLIRCHTMTHHSPLVLCGHCVRVRITTTSSRLLCS